MEDNMILYLAEPLYSIIPRSTQPYNHPW